MKSSSIEITVGALTVKFFPLTLAQMQELEEELKVLRGRENGEDYFSKSRIDKMHKVYLASAQRGDASVNIDDIRRVVDIENVADLNKAVLGQGKNLTTSDTVLAKVAEGNVVSTPMSPQIGGVSTQG